MNRELVKGFRMDSDGFALFWNDITRLWYVSDLFLLCFRVVTRLDGGLDGTATPVLSDPGLLYIKNRFGPDQTSPN